MKTILSIMIVAGLLAGCGTVGETMVVETHNPTVVEVLELSPNTDILFFDGIVYETNIDWVDELSLTVDSEVGEIKKTTSSADEFIDQTANVLPVGTKIYRAKERKDILIADDKYYYQLVEG